MEPVLKLLETLGVASLPAFWLPVGLWTAVALPVFLVIRAWRTAHPFVQYVVHVALLLALPLGLALVAAVDFAVLAAGPRVPLLPLSDGAALLSAAAVAVATPSGVVLPVVVARLAGLLVLVAGVMGAWRLLRLGAHTWSLRRFRRVLHAEAGAGTALQRRADGVARQLGLRRPVRVVVTSREVVPFTFGWRRPVVVLPVAVADDEEQLGMVLAHELVHVRRHDYGLQWMEQLVGAVFAVHPLVALVRRAIAGYREMACDAEVLARTRCSRRRYARLLYQYVLPPQTLGVVGMAASHHHFKSRLLAMKTHPEPRPAARPLAFTLAALLLAVSVGVVACTDLIDTGTIPADEPLLTAEQMPRLTDGMASLTQQIRYPEIAKLAGIQGRVLVEFVVDEQGRVVDPVVKEGIGAGCDEEALRVLSQATFEPALQDDKPVRVKLIMPFQFKLQENAKAEG